MKPDDGVISSALRNQVPRKAEQLDAKADSSPWATSFTQRTHVSSELWGCKDSFDFATRESLT